MLTITVDEMPAKSIVLLQLVMTRAGVAEDGTPLDVHIAGWVHGALADCPVDPVEPSRTPSMCVAGETVLPTINVPAIENSTYGEPVYPSVNEHERTVNLTATANAGCVFPQPADGGVIAPGWPWIDERTVEYRSALALV